MPTCYQVLIRIDVHGRRSLPHHNTSRSEWLIRYAISHQRNSTATDALRNLNGNIPSMANTICHAHISATQWPQVPRAHQSFKGSHRDEPHYISAQLDGHRCHALYIVHMGAKSPITFRPQEPLITLARPHLA